MTNRREIPRFTPRRTRRAMAMAAVVVGIAGGAVLMTLAEPTEASQASEAAPPTEPTEAPDHSAYDALLRRHVDAVGVHWAAWAASDDDRRALRGYLDRMAAARPSLLPDADRLAYWINLYNALTLDLVLGGYPVDSIKDLGGLFGSPWKKKLATVEGEPLSLDAIEHEIIRPGFDEPRIHFALNCAARSCPPLRAEAYAGERLDAQLEEQTRVFLGDPMRTVIDRKGRLRLSKILDWYRGDFEKDGSLLEWVRPYVPALARLDPGEKVKIRFLDYDWDLNEAATSAE